MRTVIVLLFAAVSIFFVRSDARAEKSDILYGIAMDAEAKTVSIVVASSGCTDKSYFNFTLEGDVLFFKRIKRDACKAMPRREVLTYTLKELGIRPDSEFRIGNPISLTEHVF